jgi:hypothetical protein
MFKYTKLVWGDEERSILMTNDHRFIVEEAVRFDAPDLYICDSFVDSICCLENLEWSERTHWDYDQVTCFVETMNEVMSNWEGVEKRQYPITTVKELRELKELLCWDAFAPSFDYRDKKSIGNEQIETSDLECYEMCVRVCTRELKEEYLKVHGCICGACSKNCKCYKDKECDAPDEE